MQQSIKCLSVEWFNWFDSDFLKILIMKTIRYLMLIILKNNRLWFQREIELAFILDESIVNIPIWNLFQPIWTHSNTNVSPPTFDVSFFCSLDCLFVCLFGRLLGCMVMGLWYLTDDDAKPPSLFTDWYLCFNTFYLDRDLCNSLFTSSVSFGCFSVRLIYSRGVNCVCVWLAGWLKLHIHKFYNDNATTVTVTVVVVVVINAVTYTGAIV